MRRPFAAAVTTASSRYGLGHGALILPAGGQQLVSGYPHMFCSGDFFQGTKRLVCLGRVCLQRFALQAVQGKAGRSRIHDAYL